MHTFIALSFTTKDQNFDAIRPYITGINAHILAANETPILIHGFLTKEALQQRGISTEVVDSLASIFPLQINCLKNGTADRKKLAELLHEFGGEVHVIGQVKEGVAEEVAEYQAAGVNIVYHEIV